MTTSNNRQSTGDLIDQHTIHALSSMVISQLPFPPMPMCVVIGEDMEDGICSSHDLLARAIAVQYISSMRENKPSMTPSDLMEKKTAVVTELLEDLLKLSSTLPTDMTDYGNILCPVHIRPSPDASLIQNIYQTFQRHFRAYFSLYPSTSQDIRFHDIDIVDASSLVMKQAISHLHAMKLQVQDPMTHPKQDYTGNPLPRSYTEALYFYFIELTSHHMSN